MEIVDTGNGSEGERGSFPWGVASSTLSKRASRMKSRHLMRRRYGEGLSKVRKVTTKKAVTPRNSSERILVSVCKRGNVMFLPTCTVLGSVKSTLQCLDPYLSNAKAGKSEVFEMK